MKRDISMLIKEMTLEEKAGMCSGLDFWHLKGVERLGIPSVMVSDGPHGLRKQDDSGDHLGINDSIKAVCFPPACLSACSFDRELIKEMGIQIGKEAQAENLSVMLGPAVNIKRSPLCGRNFEYYSEDPYLSGEMAVACIQGIQSQGVGTSIKHFAANNQEYNRLSCSSEVDERTLREIYFPAFETAVKKAQPKTVMCSYNMINGVYSSENPWLLTDVLRDEWGFKGYVMSDWGAVNERVAGLKAGLELEMPSSNGTGDMEIINAVKDGTLDEAVLDRAVERILNVVFDYIDNRHNEKLELEADHEEAKHIACESMVLLKNEEMLPLKKEEKVAFVGGFFKTPRYQGGGSSHINSFKVDSAWNCLNGEKNVTYVEGFSAVDDVYDENLAKEACEAAKNADKVVIFAGLPDSFESEGYDRKHMQLPDCQNRLISEIAKVQPNLVVVLHNGSPVEMPWLSYAKAILEAYLGGQAGGSAVAAILYGDVNPSGKLAETFPYKLADNPSYFNFACPKKVEYHEGLYVGYRYYDKKEMNVAFPFGHGLSYTTFEYSNIRLSADRITEKDTVKVSLDIKNTGDVAGKEVVQIYVKDNTGVCSRPVKELKGFEKVYLEPGETKTVTICLDSRSFAWYSTDINGWFTGSGEYEILAGASSRDIRLSAVLNIESSQILPLNLNINTTIGELMSNDKTKKYAIKFQRQMDTYFNGLDGTDIQEEDAQEEDKAVGDDMAEATTASTPLRNLVGFGIYKKEEMLALIEEMKGENI